MLTGGPKFYVCMICTGTGTTVGCGSGHEMDLSSITDTKTGRLSSHRLIAIAGAMFCDDLFWNTS